MFEKNKVIQMLDQHEGMQIMTECKFVPPTIPLKDSKQESEGIMERDSM